MALTLKRWLAVALTGFLLVPVVVIEGRNQPEWRWTERDRLVERDRIAQSHVQRAVNQLRILEMADSIVRVATRHPSAVVGIDVAFDSLRRGMIHDLALGAGASRPAAARVPTSVFFVLDTLTEVRGRSRRGGFSGALAFDYLLPTDSTSRCVVIARVRASGRQSLYHSELRSHVTRERLLGPCAYVEHFGPPGRAISEWMDARGWVFAQRGSWSHAALPWLDGMPDSAYRDRIDLQYVMDPVGVSCAAGKDEACLRALLEPPTPHPWRRSMGRTAGVLSTGFYNPFVHGDNAWLTRDWPLGSREWTLLSDMVRTIGPERFERFWTSDLPPEQAFRAATGQPLAEWTRGWIESTYHPQSGGPALPAGATGFGALLLIAGIGLSIVAARRRQTG